MKNVMTGQAAATTAAPTNYCRALIALLGEALTTITTAEYERAMQNIVACQDVATLQKWYRNCIREIARREELEPETAPIAYATVTQKQEIQKLANNVKITRPEKTRALLNINRLDYDGAKQEIGQLWAKIVSRTTGYPAPPADGWSLGVGADGVLSYSAAA